MRTISGKARLAGVIGWPVSQSQSPRLHNYWLEKHDIDGAYLPLPVRPEDLAEVLKALPRMGFRGVNLTIPHKEAALPLLDRVDETARRVGAVNTVVFDEQGKSFGLSTDGQGFIANLQQNCPIFKVARGPTVLLGAGGAAAAIAFALEDAGCPEIRIVNRSQERAETLAARVENAKAYGWNQRGAALEGAMLLVNATSLGMMGQPPLEISLDALPKHAMVTDIVYAPLETPLLKSAKQRGNLVVDGLGMLLHQAVPSFEAWFGLRPEVTPELRAHVLNGG